MKKFQKLSNSEMEIMQEIWKLDDPVTATQLQSIFASKDWKSQTISTFLSRLTDKGVLSLKKQGRVNLYAPIITEQRK